MWQVWQRSHGQQCNKNGLHIPGDITLCHKTRIERFRGWLLCPSQKDTMHVDLQLLHHAAAPDLLCIVKWAEHITGCHNTVN